MMKRSLLCLAFLTVLLGWPMAPARAASQEHFQFNTQFGGETRNGNPGGRAATEGWVTFNNARKIDIGVVFLWDVCNPNTPGVNDGFGVRMYVSVHLRYTGGQVGVGGPTYAYNGQGCDNGYGYVYSDPYTAPSGAVITGVQMSLWECTTTYCSGSPRDQALSREMDNPYT